MASQPQALRNQKAGSGRPFMEKDSKKVPSTGDWAYAQFDYGPTPGTFTPNKGGTPTCGHACHVAVTAKDYVFHPYQKR